MAHAIQCMAADIDAAYEVLHSSTLGATKRDRLRRLQEGVPRQLMAVVSSSPDAVVLSGAALDFELRWDEEAACFVMQRIANHFHDQVPVFSCSPPWVCVHTAPATPICVDVTRPMPVFDLAREVRERNPHLFEVRHCDVLAFYTVACAKFGAFM